MIAPPRGSSGRVGRKFPQGIRRKRLI